MHSSRLAFSSLHTQQGFGERVLVWQLQTQLWSTGEAHLGLVGGCGGSGRNVCGSAHRRGYRVRLAGIEADGQEEETNRVLFEQHPLCMIYLKVLLFGW